MQHRNDITLLHKEKILDSSDDIIITTFSETENEPNQETGRRGRSPEPPKEPPPPIPVHQSANELQHSRNSSTDNNKAEQKKFKVCTWNLWCMPFSSPRALSNPYRCAMYAQQIAKSQNWEQFDDLIIFNLQELWGFKTGIFPPILLWCVSWLEWGGSSGREKKKGVVIKNKNKKKKLHNVKLSHINNFDLHQYRVFAGGGGKKKVFIALFLGLLPILKCFPLTYNPKTLFAHKMRKYLPYSVQYCNVPWNCGFDNGLLMCFNKKPQAHGFEIFTSHRCDDSFAAKGFLWAYFQEYQLLVLNLHMQ
ncbi:hypothetical protein RFI_15988, partial [Reticulomyxa filosa]